MRGLGTDHQPPHDKKGQRWDWDDHIRTRQGSSGVSTMVDISATGARVARLMNALTFVCDNCRHKMFGAAS